MRVVDCLSDAEIIAAIGTGRRDVLRRGLQQLLFRYAAAWPWPHYRARGTIATIDDYSTGTVDVTQGSTTVSAGDSAPSFPAAAAGRKIRFGSQQAWYDILTRDSASQLTLVQAYQGATLDEGTYTIFQDEHRLAPNCQRPLDFIQLEDQVMMTVFTYLTFDQLFSDVGSLGDPIYLTVLGRRDDRYTTGTIALTANSRALTGSGSPAWTSVEGLGDGSRIAVEDTGEVFTVRSVDSATAITAYELAAAAETSSTYIAFMNNLRVLVRNIPDEARNLYYRYQRRPFLPVRDYDEIDAPLEHHGMFKEGVLSLAWQMKGDKDTANYYDTKFAGWLKEQIREIGHDSPMPVVVKESMDAVGVTPTRLRLPNTYGYPL